MADTSVPVTRVRRGMELARLRGEEIERTWAFTWRVPSCTGEGYYVVRLDTRTCTCPDHERAKELGLDCKHVVAAGIAAAKKRAARDKASA